MCRNIKDFHVYTCTVLSIAFMFTVMAFLSPIMYAKGRAKIESLPVRCCDKINATWIDGATYNCGFIHVTILAGECSNFNILFVEYAIVLFDLPYVASRSYSSCLDFKENAFGDSNRHSCWYSSNKNAAYVSIGNTFDNTFWTIVSIAILCWMGFSFICYRRYNSRHQRQLNQQIAMINILMLIELSNLPQTNNAIVQMPPPPPSSLISQNQPKVA